MIIRRTFIQFITLLLWSCMGSTLAFGQNANFDGPNCLNNALVESKIINYHRYSALSEINLIINSKLCQKLSSDDLSTRAIGLVYSDSPTAQKDIISHAFIRLNGELAQEKHGWAQSEPYQLTELLKIYSEYDVSNPQESVAFYTCQSWANFLDNTHPTQASLRLLESLDNIEQKLNFVMNQETVSKEQLDQLVNLIVKLSQKTLVSSLAEDLFIKQVIASRIVSISNQLAILGHNSLHSKTYHFEFKTEGIEGIFKAIVN